MTGAAGPYSKEGTYADRTLAEPCCTEAAVQEGIRSGSADEGAASSEDSAMTAVSPDPYRCPSCGVHCVVPSLAAGHCQPVGHDGQGAPIYSWQTAARHPTSGEAILAVDEPIISVS